MLLLLYQFIYSYRVYTLPTNAPCIWLLCFLAEDFSYYWFHRVSHVVRVLWASYSVHHTAEIYSLSSAGFRQTWMGYLSGSFVFWLWMPFIGFEPAMILLIKSINLIYQFCIHTETVNKMPAWFEAIFNTSSYRWVHYGSNLISLTGRVCSNAKCMRNKSVY